MARGALRAKLPLLALLLVAGPARAATVWLSLPSGSEPCSFEQLAAALRSRLPNVRVEPGVSDLDPGDVAVSMQRNGEGWSLVVRAAGEHELRRTLPPVGVDCVGLAQTAASMVERYLGEVRWTGAQVVVAPVHEAPPPAFESRWQATAVVGLAGALTPATNATNTVGLNPALELDLGARSGHWELGVSVAGELEQQAGGNQLQVIQYVPAIFQLVEGYRLKLGPGSLWLDLMPGIQVIWGTASPPSPVIPGNPPNSGSTASFTVAARASWELTIYRRLFASLRVTARVLVPQGYLFVGALPGAPYESGFEAADASVALGYLFF